MAVFKFFGLRLTGNPKISIAEGGATKLGLISVGDITSGPPGGRLTFTGLDSLLLATQNGSITLTSDLAFENIPTLSLYARGAGSTLTFDATVSSSTNLVLLSEGNIQFNDAFSLTERNPGNGAALNAYFDAAGNLVANNGLSITLDSSMGDLAGNSSVTLTTGGNLTVNGDSALSLTIANNDGGQIGGNATIGVNAGAILASSLLGQINNLGGTIAGKSTISFTVGGALTTSLGDATFEILQDTVPIDAAINVSAGSFNIGGSLIAMIGGAEAAFDTANVTIDAEERHHGRERPFGRRERERRPQH